MDTAMLSGRAVGRKVPTTGLVAGALAPAGTLGAAVAPPAAHKTIMKYSGATITNLPGQLFSISAVSQKDAWSVGFSGGAMPLILHWNGKNWTRA